MKSELKEIKQVLESIKTFIVANAQLQKETLLELQKIKRIMEVNNGSNNRG